MGWSRSRLLLNHVRAVIVLGCNALYIVRTEMDVGQVGKVTVPARASGGLNQLQPRTHGMHEIFHWEEI